MGAGGGGKLGSRNYLAIGKNGRGRRGIVSVVEEERGEEEEEDEAEVDDEDDQQDEEGQSHHISVQWTTNSDN